MFSRPEIGVCTWTFGDLPLVDIVRRIGALELNGVELLGRSDRYEAEGLSVIDVVRILQDNGLKLFSLTPDNVDIAFVLNPRLTARELVATICDELQVEYAPHASLKILIDELNRYLLESHQQNRKTVVIIDEAQNLSPDVLEQLRLLTNLETALGTALLNRNERPMSLTPSGALFLRRAQTMLNEAARARAELALSGTLSPSASSSATICAWIPSASSCASTRHSSRLACCM